MDVTADTIARAGRTSLGASLTDALRYKQTYRWLYIIVLILHVSFALEYLRIGRPLLSISAGLVSLLFAFGFLLKERGRYYTSFVILTVGMPANAYFATLMLGWAAWVHLFALAAPVFVIANPFWAPAQKRVAIAIMLAWYVGTLGFTLYYGPLDSLDPERLHALGTFNLIGFFLLMPSLMVAYARNAPQYAQALAAEERLEAAQQLARTVAHELRQPLATLRLVVDLKNLPNGDPVQDRTEMIQRQVDRIEEHINRLLQLTDLHSVPYPSGGRILKLDQDDPPSPGDVNPK